MGESSPNSEKIGPNICFSNEKSDFNNFNLTLHEFSRVMSFQITASSRSPLLQRTGYKNNQASSSLGSQSPNFFSPSISCENSVLVRPQAEAADESHDVAHLSPVLQRFWNVSANVIKITLHCFHVNKANWLMLQRSSTFSPRSLRLSNVIPQPKGANATALAKLNVLRREVAHTMEQSRKIQEIAGYYLQRHFESVPLDEVKRQIWL